MLIIEATQQNADALTRLTMRSKAHWGYSSDLMESWREELTITTDYLSKHHAFVLIDDQVIRGYYSFEVLSRTKAELDNLFVDPDFIGQGLGRLLIHHFLKKAEEMGLEKIVLDADPNARLFYQRHGFRIIGRKESSVPERVLPVMSIDLKTARKSDWKTLDMPIEQAVIGFQKFFNDEEFVRLKRGLIPHQMEDKWFIFFENNNLYFHRSWTGHCIFIASLIKTSDGAKIDQFIANRDNDQYRIESDEKDQQLLAFLIDRFLIGKQVPHPSMIQNSNKKDRK